MGVLGWGTKQRIAAVRVSPATNGEAANLAPQDRDERARRARVARVSAGLTRHQLAGMLGVSFNTIERNETGRRRLSDDELIAIGRACGVPEAYVRHGWAACMQAERLERLYGRIDELFEEVRRGFGRD